MILVTEADNRECTISPLGSCIIIGSSQNPNPYAKINTNNYSS